MRYLKNQPYWTKPLPKYEPAWRAFWKNKAGELQHSAMTFPSVKGANEFSRAEISKET